MAKITQAGGPSFSEHEQSDPDFEKHAPKEFIIRRAQLGEVDRPSHSQPEVGGHSSASSGSDATSNDTEKASHQSPAPTTESHSSAAPPEDPNSTAPLTDGNGPEMEQLLSAEYEADEEDEPLPTDAPQQTAAPRKRAAKKAAARKTASTRSIPPDDDEF